MPSVGYYRTEAERCRELAAHSPVPDMAKRWSALADDYDKLAEGLEASHDTMPVQRVPLQQQPVQQQQQQQQQKADDKANDPD